MPKSIVFLIFNVSTTTQKKGKKQSKYSYILLIYSGRVSYHACFNKCKYFRVLVDRRSFNNYFFHVLSLLVTALCVACAVGNFEIAKLLLERGAQVGNYLIPRKKR